MFESWLAAIGSVRNICAHHERLWNRDLTKQPKQLSDPFFDQASKAPNTWHRFYGVALVMAYLDRTVDPNSGTWCSRLREHLASLPTAPGIALEAMGASARWSEHPAWN